MPEIECEIVVVGGGTGGVAAALASARRSRNVCLVEETDWLGGQLTSQGVSALDEHDLIEGFGGTASYYGLRELIRDHYADLGLLRGDGGGNPGSCWVSRLAFEPTVAVRAIDALLAPFVESGAVQILRRCKPIGVRTAGGRVESVTVLDLVRLQLRRLRAEFVVDATELGDLLPLAGLDYVVGAEAAAETGEPHAQPDEPKPECVQSFTYTFALERTSRRAFRADSGAREVRALSRRTAVQPHDRGARGRDLRRGERLALLPALRADGRHERLALDVPQACRREGAAARLPQRHDHVQLAGQRLPRPLDPGSPVVAGRRRPSGRETGEPRLPPLAPDRGADRGRAARRARAPAPARPDGHDGRPLEAPLHPRVAAHPRPQDGRRAGRVGRVPVRPARGAVCRLGRRSAGIRSTSTAPARRTSASARGHARSRSRSAR